MNFPEQEIELEVFRTGDYGPRGAFSEEDLERIATDYNPSDHEAPVTLDHDQTGPAHGWVSGLRRIGDRLLARLSKVSPTLAESLRNATFRKRSIELYRKFPETGRSYLKAVSFLGAAAPIVKGLRDPIFSGDPDVETISFTEDFPNFAAEARDELIRRGCWKPEWEAAGLLDVFSAIGDAPARDALLGLLEKLGNPVSFGQVDRSGGHETEAQFSESLVGGCSDASLERHRRATELLRAAPQMDYREALIRANS